MRGGKGRGGMTVIHIIMGHNILIAIMSCIT